MNSFKTLTITAFTALCMLNACEKATTVVTPVVETPKALNIVTIKDISADVMRTGRATYFRFADSSIVTGADTASDKWDIAFIATRILTNSGVSGATGKGGAMTLTATDFEGLATVPEAGWRTDSSAANLAITASSAKGWYNYDMTTNIISPIPGVVLAVRTGDGKFAKVQILSYYQGAPNPPNAMSVSRYMAFRYVYQTNGSRTVK